VPQPDGVFPRLQGNLIPPLRAARTSVSWWFGQRSPALTAVLTFSPGALGRGVLASRTSVSLWFTAMYPALTLVLTFRPWALGGRFSRPS
jgi:hypothetical protein